MARIVSDETSQRTLIGFLLLKTRKGNRVYLGDWEKEVITEIKIRADAVDQSYVS
jgi:hypothetical protein